MGYDKMQMSRGNPKKTMTMEMGKLLDFIRSYVAFF